MLPRVNIRPGVSVLSVLRHLNYTYWHALAEFVDNAIQSYHSNRAALEAVGGRHPLRVEITADPDEAGRIIVRDNAAGIGRSEFGRAFKPAEAPSDRSGLSEFGMGMKSAACWCGHEWEVRTKPVGDPHEFTISFDIDRIVAGGIEELDVAEEPALVNDHYTEIELRRLNKIPAGRTLGKIKDHLTDIYRTFTRSGELELYFNGELLQYKEPPILRAPFYKEEAEPPRLWRHEIEFDFGNGLSVTGFAALRERASTSRAGFALFRRGRLIQGSGDEGYRPEVIFGKSNSFIYQRLFGELHLEGFEVSHTKDGFKWDENEEVFLDLLKDHLSSPEMPLLQQAKGYRVGDRPDDLQKGAEAAANQIAAVVKDGLSLPDDGGAGADAAPPPEMPDTLPAPSRLLTKQEFEFTAGSWKWKVLVELTAHDPAADWLEVASGPAHAAGKEYARTIELRVSLQHPFMRSFAAADPDMIDPLLRIAVALAVAEALAKETAQGPATVRYNLNKLLRTGLSKPA
jgi:hypothetical protein